MFARTFSSDYKFCGTGSPHCDNQMAQELNIMKIHNQFSNENFGMGINYSIFHLCGNISEKIFLTIGDGAVFKISFLSLSTCFFLFLKTSLIGKPLCM